MNSNPNYYQYNLAIAGLAVQLQVYQPEVAAIAEKRYRGFFDQDAEPCMVCDIHLDPRNNNRASSDLSVKFTADGLSVDSPEVNGAVNLDNGHAAMHCFTTQSESVLDYFLRMVFALLIYEAGGLMLHGAGIIRSEKAVVFFGHSGSGKTTVSQLSGEENVLNDDLLMLMPGDQGWRVAATPFWNPKQVRPSARQARLGGIFRLVQDNQVFLRPARSAEALAELISAVPILNADPKRMPVILERLAHLHAGYPVQFLHFLPDDSFWQVVMPLLDVNG